MTLMGISMRRLFVSVSMVAVIFSSGLRAQSLSPLPADPTNNRTKQFLSKLMGTHPYENADYTNFVNAMKKSANPKADMENFLKNLNEKLESKVLSQLSSKNSSLTFDDDVPAIVKTKMLYNLIQTPAELTSNTAQDQVKFRVHPTNEMFTELNTAFKSDDPNAKSFSDRYGFSGNTVIYSGNLYFSSNDYSKIKVEADQGKKLLTIKATQRESDKEFTYTTPLTDELFRKFENYSGGELPYIPNFQLKFNELGGSQVLVVNRDSSFTHGNDLSIVGPKAKTISVGSEALLREAMKNVKKVSMAPAKAFEGMDLLPLDLAPKHCEKA